MFGERKLGFGLMRLPVTDPNRQNAIDIEQVKQMVDHFIENGFTYFDTALMYMGGDSEAAAKEALVDRYPRDKFTLATKLHAGFFKDEEDGERVFQNQLKKCGVDYFDYYLLHDIGEDHYRMYTERNSFEWLARKKAEGKVKHMGFSFHDRAALLDRVLTEHPEVDFVQLQLNYLDWDSEAIQSRLCYEVATKHGKPVIVMEPVKGGTLVNVPDAVKEMYEKIRPDMSVASWAIRFAASQPNVKMVLSGMSNMEQMKDNTSYMQNFEPLSKEEMEAVTKAVGFINGTIAIPCTACSYCVDGCPMNIPIPNYFSLYNLEKQEVESKGWTPQGEYYSRLSETHGKASDCIECRQCEGVCPQHLPIVDHLKSVAGLFE
ncbi:MAG: aldo/keto reductase [Lachnospiraceae bacterium]|nr:aldo/keto reductase [Lachnospiraceae bacterium]